MASALLGLVLDSSTAISAERRKQSVPDFIESILRAHGPLDLSLSPVTVAELVHGIFRAQTPAAAQTRRLFVEELVSLVPVHPVTKQTGWLVGQIEGQEAAKGNVLPFNELMIAAAAIEQGYAVLTTNLRHFQKIPNLNESGNAPFFVERRSTGKAEPCGCAARSLDRSGPLRRPIWISAKGASVQQAMRPPGHG